MESLYRKYRPQTFSDVVGQQHVVGTLERAVLEGRTSHAYLFCGPRGTGKTTMARLLAKALMCELGPARLPDGTCEQCQLIAAGDHPDVYELDAASRTGVDNVREEIINRVDYAPVQGRFKVYIIDEVHMLTTAAFNALLKTLEEPPSHVVFVLCTTDPQKIPATILSRVQRFDFRPISNDDILARLVHVCEWEGFTYEDAALELVVRNARGGMRDALSMLEQLSVFGSGVIGLDATRDMLGAVSGDALDHVVDALARRDVATLFSQIGTLVDAGRDLLQFTRELAVHMRDVYVVAAVGNNPEVLPAASDPTRLQQEAAAFGSVDRLARILSLLGDVSREMSTAPNQRLVLEIAFTRIARPEADLTLDSLAERIAELEHKLHALQSGAPRVVAAEAAPTPQPKPAPTMQPGPARQHVPAQRSEPAPKTQPRPRPAPPVDAPVAKPAARGQAASMDGGALQRAWRQVVTELIARIPARGSLLSSAMATSDNGKELVIGLPKGSAFALKMLDRPDVRSAVESVVEKVFGPRTLVFKEGLGADLQIPQAKQQGQRQGRAQSQPQHVGAAYGKQRVSAPQPASTPQPATPSYAMPWDDPAPSRQQAPQPVSEPAYDEPVYESVPYEEFDAMGYIPSEPECVPDPQTDPAPAPAPEPRTAPSPAPQSVPVAQSDTDPDSDSIVEQKPKRNIPTELPPELAAILENAFDVFGNDVKVSR
jgi:DNA polymerase-3 subunit gamma/tau